MNDNLSPEEIAAAAEAAEAANGVGGAPEGGEAKTAEQIAEEERLAAEAAAAAQPPADEDDIPEEKVYGKLSKLTGDRIRSKEDLDKVLAFNETDYIKVDPKKAELIRKLNDFNGGDIKTFIELSEMDVDALSDKKDTIIRSMMIQKGYSREDAELLFDEKFKDANISEEDVDFDAKKKRVAELLMEEEFANAKSGLAKYKSEKIAGLSEKQPTQEEIEMLRREREDKWLKPMNTVVDSVEKLESTVTFKLPDEQEVTETIVFDVKENNETRDLIKSIIADPSTFGEKFAAEFGKGKTLEEGVKNMAEALTYLKHREQHLALAAKIGGDRALAEHLEKVNPGSLKKMTQTTTVVPDDKGNKTFEEAIIEAANKAAMGKRRP